NVGSGKDGLIGFFQDDAGQSYFMLTNLFEGQNSSASSTALSFKISFASNINEVLRLNRITGEPQKLVLNNHELFLSLPGGTGDLFKYNTGYFAGIPGGDANIDGVVDTLDFNLLAVNFAQSGKTWKQGDFTFDGVVDTIDFNVLAAN